MKKVKEYFKNSLAAIVIGGQQINTIVKSITPYNDVDTIIEGKVMDIINYVVGFTVVVAIGLIIFSAYLFITATGDPDKISQAQKTLTASIIGMVIVFLSRALVIFFLTAIMGVQ